MFSIKMVEFCETVFIQKKHNQIIGTHWEGCRGAFCPSKHPTSMSSFRKNIPPALWATGGLEVVTGKLPLSLPSPRALDPARLDRSRVYITFSKAYKTPSESLQKCGAN